MEYCIEKMKNRILQRNLEVPARGNLYNIIERDFDIHLSTPDKFLLKDYLDTQIDTCFDDLIYDAYNYLWKMGFRSIALKEAIEEDKKWEKYWAKKYQEAYDGMKADAQKTNQHL